MSVESGSMPEGLSPALKALWYDRAGDWQRAHSAVQEENDRCSAWVHAYLHRKEGDIGNARYWYSRAGKRASDTELGVEWSELFLSLTGSI